MIVAGGEKERGQGGKEIKTLQHTNNYLKK